jgi:hypothetical protein
MTAALKEPAATVVVCSAVTAALYAMGKLKVVFTILRVVLNDQVAPAWSGNTASAWGGSNVTLTVPKRPKEMVAFAIPRFESWTQLWTTAEFPFAFVVVVVMCHTEYVPSARVNVVLS